MALFRYFLSNIFARRMDHITCSDAEVLTIDAEAHDAGRSILSMLPDGAVMLNFNRVGFSLDGKHAIVGVCLFPSGCGNCYPQLLEKGPDGWFFAEE